MSLSNILLDPGIDPTWETLRRERAATRISDISDAVHLSVQSMPTKTWESVGGLTNSGGTSYVTGLYFGVGLSSKGNKKNGTLPMLSYGLPIDVLGMLFVAEKFDCPKHILIADSHAFANDHDPHDISRVANGYHDTLQRVVDNLGLNGWSIVIASSLAKQAAYQKALSKIQDPNQYVRLQLTDMRYFEQEMGVNLKVGWSPGEQSFDEMFVDTFYGGGSEALLDEDNRDPLRFIYTHPGRSLNPRRSVLPPYIVRNPEDRIMLEKGEDVEAKLSSAVEKHGDKAILAYKNLMKGLAHFYRWNLSENSSYLSCQGLVDRCVQ